MQRSVDAGFRAITALCGTLALALGGCGGDKDAMQARVNELRDEVVRLQNGQDRLEERLATMELNRQRAPAEPDPSPARVEVERPNLPVVKLRPDGPAEGSGAEPAAEEAEEPSRPLLKAQGDRILSGLEPEDGARAKATGLRKNKR
jgi:hypothetical protein